MDCEEIKVRIATVDERGRPVGPSHAFEEARRIEVRREAEAAGPLSRWNLAGAGVVVVLLGVYAWLLLR